MPSRTHLISQESSSTRVYLSCIHYSLKVPYCALSPPEKLYNNSTFSVKLSFNNLYVSTCMYVILHFSCHLLSLLFYHHARSFVVCSSLPAFIMRMFLLNKSRQDWQPGSFACCRGRQEGPRGVCHGVRATAFRGRTRPFDRFLGFSLGSARRSGFYTLPRVHSVRDQVSRQKKLKISARRSSCVIKTF